MLETAEDCKVEKALELFVEAVEFSPDLEIIGTADTVDTDGEVFVLRDYSKIEGVVGSYVEVSISELVEKVSNMDRAIEFLRIIQNKRNPIVLHGITRIVGYYSRMSNWNKSKVGELRDRTQRNYALNGQLPTFDKDRNSYIDNLS